MAKKNNNNKKNNSKVNINKRNNIKSKVNEKNNNIQNTFIMKTLIVLGVIILCVAIVYLMNYFFVENSDIKINMSTDKKLEYITIAGKEELITTQKYVSDLNYNMRYDVDNFAVFKYKEQDIYRYLNDEKIVIVIEKSALPNNCETTTLEMEYNNCMVDVDNYTDEYYISKNNETYKLTVKSTNSIISGLETRINYMLNSFEINI